jgi:dTDP-4-dehydrorhamnose 3,5-epimerase
MKIETSSIFSEVIIFTPIVFTDDRGGLFESYNQSIADVLKVDLIQENHSMSKKNVIRGLHYQWDKPMGKLCRVIKGTALDLIVDIRKDSPTFGLYDSIILDDQNHRMIWIPPGFAHGFVSLSDETHFLYKCSSYYNKSCEGIINLFDKQINISYPINLEDGILSEKDKIAQSLTDYLKDPKF